MIDPAHVISTVLCIGLVYLFTKKNMSALKDLQDATVKLETLAAQVAVALSTPKGVAESDVAAQAASVNRSIDTINAALNPVPPVVVVPPVVTPPAAA